MTNVRLESGALMVKNIIIDYGNGKVRIEYRDDDGSYLADEREIVSSTDDTDVSTFILGEVLTTGEA